jgi:hypothetical protein
MGEWKAIRHNVRKDPSGPVELYNLKDDPFEEHDIADLHLEIVKRLCSIMDAEHHESEHFPLVTGKVNESRP